MVHRGVQYRRSSKLNGLWGRVKLPTDGIVHELPMFFGSRSGAIPEPTVTVRMGKDDYVILLSCVFGICLQHNKVGFPEADFFFGFGIFLL